MMQKKTYKWVLYNNAYKSLALLSAFHCGKLACHVRIESVPSQSIALSLAGVMVGLQFFFLFEKFSVLMTILVLP